MSQSATQYEPPEINPRYDDQSRYGCRSSHFGNGRYPPDWSARRDAVWERQKYQCGRCRTYKGDTSINEVHHVVHLADGGSNHLDNLVGLCGDCHALMHPDVDALRGVAHHAQLFPDRGAEDLVAVIRQPTDSEDLETDLDRLGTVSAPDDNANALTSMAISTSATVAKRAESDLYDFLVDEGYVPRTSDYHCVRIVPTFMGLRGIVTSFVPEVTVSSDGAVTEREWIDGTPHCDVFYTPDASETAITLRDGVGEESEERLELGVPRGSRVRLERNITPPPLSFATVPRYTVDTARYFGWKSIKWGILLALLVALLVPSALPSGSMITGVLSLAFGFGLLLRTPWIANDLLEAWTPSEERTERAT